MADRTVGIFPGLTLQSRPRLFGALGTAFNAEFVDGSTRAPGDITAALVVDDPGILQPGDAAALATELAGRGLRCLLAGAPHDGAGDGLDVRFASPSLLDDRLQSRVLREGAGRAAPPVAARAGDIVIATGPDGPLWVSRRIGPGILDHAAQAPIELGPEDRLKDHLQAGRFLSLLPTVHFLREVLASSGWKPPPRRASFVVDDPNLHWPSYGYLRYPELAAHVASHQYHLGIAMVPADAAFAHPAAVAAFRGNPGLSLVVHGNNHRKFELAQPQSAEEALALAAQALRRTAAFERRHRLAIDRVMVPPHARCSERMMRAIRAVGFEAICYEGEGQDRGSGPVLAGWGPADTEDGEGLPRIHRVGLGRPIDEIVLRAFLDQPLVLSGHHNDLADLDRLAEAAALVEGLGAVQWMSLSGLSRSNFATCREGSTLRVRPYCRWMAVDLPGGIDHVVVDVAPVPWSGKDKVRLVATKKDGNQATISGVPGEPLPTGRSGLVDISLFRPGDIDPATVPPPPLRPWPIVRRCMTEGRDRLRPLLPRARSGRRA